MLNFGSVPAYEASIAVTGQVGILPTSHVRISLQGDTSGLNSDADYLLAAECLSFVSDKPLADVGFTISGLSNFALWTGPFRLRWRWT